MQERFGVPFEVVKLSGHYGEPPYKVFWMVLSEEPSGYSPCILTSRGKASLKGGSDSHPTWASSADP
jgi:hypothetical protein